MAGSKAMAKLFLVEDAFHIGAVNRVVADDELDAFVEDCADRLAANALLTIRIFKADVVELRMHERGRDTAWLDTLVAQRFESEDYTEGRCAFMERRKLSSVSQ